MNKLIKTEAKLVVREPIGLAFSLLLPLGLVLAFGLSAGVTKPDPNLDGQIPLDTVLPSLALALSFGMLAIFMLPGFMADYRARGILRRLSTTPVHPAKLLAAQVAVQAVIALISVPLVLGLGVALGMNLPEQPLTVLGVVAARRHRAVRRRHARLRGRARPEDRLDVYSAAFFFPSLFFAGIWLPKEQMPDWLSADRRLHAARRVPRVAGERVHGHRPGPADAAHARASPRSLAGTVAARVFRWE